MIAPARRLCARPDGSAETVELWSSRPDGLVAPSRSPAPRRSSTAAGSCPGLVDAHCHVGLGPDGPVDLDEAEDQARTDRDAGTLLLRDCGSPMDTRRCRPATTCRRSSAPPGTWPAPSATSPAWPWSSTTRRCCPSAVAEQAAAGDGWVKLVGDWIDRGVGDLAPLWPDDVLVAAIDAAHAAGARVTAHVFGADALPGLIRAGIDCIEHGTGLTDDLIAEMARRGTALVPTLINVETFPAIADRRRGEVPGLRRAHARAARRRARRRRRAVEAGVPVYAGTDAGGGIAHGRIADEVVALRAAGHPDALGAASWAAREWLGRPGSDRRAGRPGRLPRRPAHRPGVLHEPTLTSLRGRPGDRRARPRPVVLRRRPADGSAPAVASR